MESDFYMPLDFIKKHLSLKVDCLHQPEMFEKAISEISVNGLNLELGYYVGNTANKICDILKDKILYSFESFEGLEEDVEPVGHKGSCKWRGELPKIHNNVRLVIGRVQEVLDGFLETHKEDVAFLNFDMAATPDKYVLCRLAEKKRLKKGTIICLSHAIKLYPGNKIYDTICKAYMEFINEFNVKYEYIVCGDVHLVIRIKENV